MTTDRSTAWPILRGYTPEDILATSGRSEEPITAPRFLSDIAALAACLPEAETVINLCSDRYRFAVGLMAALVRQQVTLLPSSDAPGILSKLARDHRSLYFLYDGAPPPHGERALFAYPATLPEISNATCPEVAADQEAVVLFTSGSTGDPVPQPRQWGALVASTRAAGNALGLDQAKGASILGTVPHQHSYGLESTLMLALQHGLRFHRSRPLLPADILTALDAMPEPRVLVTTPVHLRALVAQEGPWPRVRHIVCATAPLSAELAREAETVFGGELREIYGCSEVGQVAWRRSTETALWTPFKGIELSPKGTDIWASGPAAARSAALNDVIELEEDGRFTLHGRKADMINVAGKRSSLAYLNHRLNAISGVDDGVFISPEDSPDGTHLMAYVVAPTLTSEAILAELRQHLDPVFLPRPIRFVAALPRNSLGKLTSQARERLLLESVER